MKNFTNLLCFVIFLLVASGLLAQTGPTVYNNGAHIVSQSGTTWVLSGGNFTLRSESPTDLATIANLKIQSDATFTLTPASYLTVSGTLTNEKGTDGLVLQSTAAGTSSLIQATNGVNATINRYITGSPSLLANMYHLVSVPLTPETNSTSNLFLGGYLYDFNVAGNAWNSLGNSTTTILYETKGYMVYSPEATHTYILAGPINAGSFSPTVVYAGSGNNLVPNPYPSAIDWDASGGNWVKTNIANATYIWNVNAAVPYQEGKVGNYAAYVNGAGTNGGSRYIPAGQAFFVKATAASPVLTMNDNVRVHSSQPFFKDEEVIPDLLRINAEANNFKDEAVVRFTENATTSADNDFDAWKMYGTDGAPQLYTLATDNEMLAINSLPYLETAYTVPMNFEMKANQPVTFTFTNLESFDPSVTIFLKDELTSQTINLRNQQVYNFNHNSENAANRFKLVFGGTIGVDEIAAETNKMWISGNTLYITAPELAGQNSLIEVYNVSGQKLMSKTVVLSELSTIELNCKGFVVAKLTSGQKVITTKGILR
jgi:hypothetical protein